MQRAHKAQLVSRIKLAVVGVFVAIGAITLHSFVLSLKASAIDNNMQGSGTIYDPYLIETCQNLQDINLDLSAYYRLNADIDCSDTSTWNSGKGFLPLGINDSTPFSGSLDGRNHTINNIFINNSSGSYRWTGLFGVAYWGASIFNLNITNAAVYGNTNPIEFRTGGLVGQSNAVIDHVAFNGAVYQNSCDGGYVGGLVGWIDSADILTSSTSGTLTVSGTNCDIYPVSIGGMVGLSRNTLLNNAYADMAITVDGESDATSCNGYNCRLIGGLVGVQDTNGHATIDHSYSAGSINVTGDTGPISYLEGGLYGSAITNNVTISNSFSAAQVSAADYSNTAGIAGRMYGDFLSNLYYDKTNNPAERCIVSDETIPCTAVNTDGSQPDYFKNNSANAPLDSWNFTNNWQTSSNNYPQLRSSLRTVPHASNLSTNTIGATTIQLSWQQNAPTDPNVDLYSFDIICKKSSETTWQNCATVYDGSATSASVENLEPDTPYDFKIITVADNGLFSDDSDVVQGNNVAVPAATNLAISFPTTTSITLTWDQDEPLEPGLLVTGYIVYCKKTTDSTWNSCSTVNDAAVKEATIYDLDSDAQYQFKIRSFGSFGTHSTESAVATRAKTQLQAATNLQTAIISDQAILLNWEQVDPVEPDTAITGFVINCKKSSDSNWNVCATINDPQTREATISSLIVKHNTTSQSERSVLLAHYLLNQKLSLVLPPDRVLYWFMIAKNYKP